MKYELYTAPTPNGWKVSIALEELRVPYELKALDFAKSEQKTAEFKAFNPNQRIPALYDPESRQRVFDSNAILLHLAKKHNELLPKDGGSEAEFLSWLFFQSSGLGPMMGQAFVFENYFNERIPTVIDRYVGETRRLFSVLNDRLSVSKYLAGDEYTVADIACLPWVNLHELIAIEMEDYPNLDSWRMQLLSRGAVQKGLQTPPAFSDEERLRRAKKIVNV